MAIKFSTKQQTPPAAAKPAKAAVDVKKPSAAPEADDTSVAATDLFKSPADAASRKTRKK
jgi:hypothetical protein